MFLKNNIHLKEGRANERKEEVSEGVRGKTDREGKKEEGRKGSNTDPPKIIFLH